MASKMSPRQVLPAIFLALTSSVGLASDDLPPPQFTDSARRANLAGGFPQVESMMIQRTRELNIPGLAYGIVIDGELVAVRGLGFRDVESKAPVDEDTVFRIASMTKSFTALAILKLRDAGKLSLDDPVVRHIPELASLAPPTKDSGPVTIRHLLTHSGGLPEDNPWADRKLDAPEQELSDLMRRAIPFSNAPGMSFEYSNTGFAILGRVVARASGMRYREYVDREILRPLGMTSTFWEPKAVPRSRLATGYKRSGEGFVVEEPLEDGAFASIGGILTSSRDLARWVALMLSAFPPRDDAERAPASRRTLREMQFGSGSQSLYAGRPVPGAPLTIRAFSQGFGLFAFRDCEFAHGVTHSGGLPGFGSNMRWLPEHGVGVFVMGNVTNAPGGRLAAEALSLLAATGGLEPRLPSPSPALLRAATQAGRLLDAWDDANARGIAAENLFLDESLEARREAIGKLRDGLGACRMETLKPENALRGSFRMTCERGWLDATLTLSPTQPPRVQHLGVTGGRPLSAGLKQSVDDVIAAIAKGSQNLRLAKDLDRAAVGAALENARLQYGACHAAEVIDGDGAARASVRLKCDRGPVVLSISTDGGQLAKLGFGRPDDATCAP